MSACTTVERRQAGGFRRGFHHLGAGGPVVVVGERRPRPHAGAGDHHHLDLEPEAGEILLEPLQVHRGERHPRLLRNVLVGAEQEAQLGALKIELAQGLDQQVLDRVGTPIPPSWIVSGISSSLQADEVVVLATFAQDQHLAIEEIVARRPSPFRRPPAGC